MPQRGRCRWPGCPGAPGSLRCQPSIRWLLAALSWQMTSMRFHSLAGGWGGELSLNCSKCSLLQLQRAVVLVCQDWGASVKGDPCGWHQHRAPGMGGIAFVWSKASESQQEGQGRGGGGDPELLNVQTPLSGPSAHVQGWGG